MDDCSSDFGRGNNFATIARETQDFLTVPNKLNE
jgi:hypothetical protein